MFFLYARPSTSIIIRGVDEDIRLARQGQGQPFRGQTLSRPRTGMLEAKNTGASVLSKKKKKTVFKKKVSGDLKKKATKNFSGELKKKVLKIFFQAIYKIFTIQKIVLSSSRGQGNFRKLEAPRPRPKSSKCVLEDSTSDDNS